MIRSALIMILMGVLLNAPAHAEAFFESIQDLPLMPGLEELSEYTVRFDKPEGRVIEAVAVLNGLNTQDVSFFYQEALPQFGWSRIENGVYQRESEILRFHLEGDKSTEFLRITVIPK